MLVTLRRFFTRAALVVAAALLIGFGLPRLIAEVFARPRLHTIETAPTTMRVAIVFGAGLLRDGTPTAVLRDRVETAAALYQDGKVEKLLMSGDNRFVEYNEPAAMRDYAVRLGVPAADIVLDFAGRRTYDTCFRAKAIFGLNEAVLVTQRFHLARALLLCNNLGVESEGVIADRRTYRRSSLAFWQFRELAAAPVTLWEIWVSRPMPVLGDPEPIFSDQGFLQRAQQRAP
jgi:SanA protein